MVAVSIGPPEILVIVLIVAFLFGAKKIPELARSLGRAQSEFKRGLKETAEEESGRPAQGEARKAGTPEGEGTE